MDETAISAETVESLKLGRMDLRVCVLELASRGLMIPVPHDNVVTAAEAFWKFVEPSDGK